MSNYNQYSGYGGNPYGEDQAGAYGSSGGGYGSANPYGEQNPYATDYGQTTVRQNIEALSAHVY
jgi:syntaxin 1B/2/3